MIRLSSAQAKKLKTLARASAVQADKPGTAGPARKAASQRMPGGDGGSEFSFEIPLAPQPKERARTYADKGVMLAAFREARGDAERFMAIVSQKLMRTVTPEATRRFEMLVASHAGAAMRERGLVPFEVPLEMSVDFILSGSGGEWPVAHADGDLDNMEKALLDGLNKIVWADDRLVVGKSARKLTGARAHILVTVRPAGLHARQMAHADFHASTSGSRTAPGLL